MNTSGDKWRKCIYINTLWRRDVVLYLHAEDLSRRIATKLRRNESSLRGAWVKTLEYDELEGANTENTIEKLTICYQYWTKE